jgi:hypothetical protein
MRFGLIAVGFSMTALVAGAACSSSSSGTPTNGDNTDSGGGSSGGSNDSGGSTGDATEPADTGSTTIPSIQCGSNTCNAVSGGFLTLTPCCLANNGCGATFGAASFANFDASAYLSMFDASGFDAAAFDASDFDAAAITGACFDTSAGTPDTSCPSTTAMGYSLAGCCTAQGVCGVDLSTVGLGCNSLSALGPLASVDGSTAAPQACGGASDSGTPETGTSDSGNDGAP